MLQPAILDRDLEVAALRQIDIERDAQPPMREPNFDAAVVSLHCKRPCLLGKAGERLRGQPINVEHLVTVDLDFHVIVGESFGKIEVEA
jgi:hypothetical protein